MIFYIIRQVAPKIINLEQRHEGLAEISASPAFLLFQINDKSEPIGCYQKVRIILTWWSGSNLKRIIKDTILNHQINVFAFFRGIPKNDDKSSIFQYLYMLLVSNRCRHLRFARHNTQAILESVLLL